MTDYRAIVVSAVSSWLALTCSWRVASAVELLNQPDLPPGVLYPSGVGDPSPAWIHSVDADLLNPAYEGDKYLRVKTGTVLNGGGTFGGVVFAMPDAFVNMPTPKFYRLTYALKGDNPFVSPIFDVHVSNQSGVGDDNSLSHTVTTDAGWLLYEHETTLNGMELPSGWFNVPRNQLFFWTDTIHGGPGQTFAIDAVRLEAFSAADFDTDGDVDGDDLASWQAGYPVGTTHIQGDANGDGKVNGADFLIWQQQFGSSILPLTSVAVPEPNFVTLFLCVLLSTLIAPRRPR